MRKFAIQTESQITDQDIADIVVAAFEGGSNYWLDKAECMYRNPQGEWCPLDGERYDDYVVDGVAPYANPEFWDNDKRGYRMHDLYDEKWLSKVLTLSSILKAMQYQPKHQKGVSDNWFKKVVSSVVSGDMDAGDADCIVQVAVFNEVVYA